MYTRYGGRRERAPALDFDVLHRHTETAEGVGPYNGHRHLRSRVRRKHALPFMPYRKMIQSVMGLVYSIPKSETTDGVARELGARMRLCLKR